VADLRSRPHHQRARRRYKEVFPKLETLKLGQKVSSQLQFTGALGFPDYLVSNSARGKSVVGGGDFNQEFVWYEHIDYGVPAKETAATYATGALKGFSEAELREAFPIDMSVGKGRLASSFGAMDVPRAQGAHKGIDLGCPVGTSLRFLGDGKITKAWREDTSRPKAKRLRKLHLRRVSGWSRRDFRSPEPDGDRRTDGPGTPPEGRGARRGRDRHHGHDARPGGRADPRDRRVAGGGGGGGNHSSNGQCGTSSGGGAGGGATGQGAPQGGGCAFSAGSRWRWSASGWATPT